MHTAFQGGTGGTCLHFPMLWSRGWQSVQKRWGGRKRKTTTVEVWQRHSPVIINSCQWALKPSLDREAVPNGLCFFPVCLCLFFVAALMLVCVCALMCLRVCVLLFHLYSEGCTLWLIMGVFMPVSNESRTWVKKKEKEKKKEIKRRSFFPLPLEVKSCGAKKRV